LITRPACSQAKTPCGGCCSTRIGEGGAGVGEGGEGGEGGVGVGEDLGFSHTT